jgi:hypothetical protein
MLISLSGSEEVVHDVRFAALHTHIVSDSLLSWAMLS